MKKQRESISSRRAQGSYSQSILGGGDWEKNGVWTRVWYSITFFFSWNNTTYIASFLESGLGLEFASCGKIDCVPVQGLCIKRPVFCVHESSEQPDKYNYVVEEITWRVHLDIEKGPETTWGEIEGGSYKLNSQLPVNQPSEISNIQDYSKTSRTVKLSPVQMRTEWLFF